MGHLKFKMAAHFPRWPPYRYELATETTVQMVIHAPKLAQILLDTLLLKKHAGHLKSKMDVDKDGQGGHHTYV